MSSNQSDNTEADYFRIGVTPPKATEVGAKPTVERKQDVSRASQVKKINDQTYVYTPNQDNNFDQALDEVLEPLAYFNGGIDDWGAPTDDDIQSEIKEAKAKILSAHNSSLEEAVRLKLQKIYENGHGGGNWRRLILQELTTLTKDQEKQ